MQSKLGPWRILRRMHDGSFSTYAVGYASLSLARAAARRASGMFAAHWKLTNDKTGETHDYTPAPRNGRIFK